jgi:hypothetical protein
VKEQPNAKKKFVLPWIIKLLDHGAKYIKISGRLQKKTPNFPVTMVSKLIAQGNVFFFLLYIR